MTQKKNLIQGILFAVPMIMVFLATDCKHTPTEPTTPSFAVTDVNCTEAWLHVTYSSARNTTVILKRNDAAIDTFLLTTSDTTFADTGLAPAHTYQYTALLDNKSETATATTMDTTSHNFTWQTFTLGDGTGSSTLFDVAIINDTLAYAVGTIYQGGSAYNLAKWNGSNWQLYQLFYNGNNLIVPIDGILYFGTDDVWLAAGSVFHWNGDSSQIQLSFSRLTLPDPNATIQKIWGSSSSSLYGVGNAGTIVHYNGSSWTKIESGTSLPFNDIWGGVNTNTNQTEIIAIASQLDINSGNAIIQINGTTATAVDGNALSWGINGIWFVPNRHYYIVGGGIYEKHLLSDPVWKNNASSFFTSTKVRGNAMNDVIVVGAFGEVLHYNGATWKDFLLQTGINGAYGGLAVKGNTVIAVGQKEADAVILMGTHN